MIGDGLLLPLIGVAVIAAVFYLAKSRRALREAEERRLAETTTVRAPPEPGTALDRLGQHLADIRAEEAAADVKAEQEELAAIEESEHAMANWASARERVLEAVEMVNGTLASHGIRLETVKLHKLHHSGLEDRYGVEYRLDKGHPSGWSDQRDAVGVGVYATADKISIAQLSLRAAWPPSDGQWESAIDDGTVDIEVSASSQAIADGIAEVVQWLLS